MNSKNTLLWIVLAAGLFAFIFFYEQHQQLQPVEPNKVLPEIRTAAVSSVLIRAAGQREIRVERTNGSWRLTQPVVYPAQNARVETLLDQLTRLAFVTYISEQELKNQPRADEEFGVEPPQTSLTIFEGDYRRQIHIGHHTPPGDQVYLQIVGVGGIYVVDAEWLKQLPLALNDWRETALADFSRLTFNRILVTNVGSVLELQRNPTNKLWRMVQPMKASADSEKIERALQQFLNLRALQFVSDDPKADFDQFGLAPPELSLSFAQDTNSALTLDFGKTNANLVYAHQRGFASIVTVTNAPLEPWRASYENFRNRHLLTLTSPVRAIEVHARDTFTLQWQGSNSWRVLPQNFPADAILVDELIGNLSGMQVTEFVKDSVPEVELPRYGFAPPVCEFILNPAATNSTGQFTNPVIGELQFGTNQENKVFARQVGESFVYAISPADLEELPSASWQMRERRLWHFREDQVASITLQEGGATRKILHNGPEAWSLAPGSQGMINVGGVEEAAHLLGQLAAVLWVEHGGQNRERFGFKPDGLQLTIELKTGEKFNVEFGGEASPGIPYASVMLDNEPWIFAFPPGAYQYVQLYLSKP